MTLIKICGVTTADDARAAAEAGADLLGFNFVPASPRYVGADLHAARRLLATVPPLVWRVGVFDSLDADAARDAGMDVVQYYARAEAEADDAAVQVRRYPLRMRAYRVRGEESLREIEADASPRDLILLDAYSPNALGGTGHTFNWELAVRAKAFGLPIVLAGGLTPDNVGEAVAAVRPYAVDVASGVESSPGVKDHDKVRRFIRAVREADAAVSGGR
jgi:phosphoribosylanthranilate isomerase